MDCDSFFLLLILSMGVFFGVLLAAWYYSDYASEEELQCIFDCHEGGADFAKLKYIREGDNECWCKESDVCEKQEKQKGIRRYQIW